VTAPSQALERIAAARLIAIVRTDDLDEALRVTDVLHGAGIQVIEYSLAGASALAALRTCRERFGGGVLIGAGTVLTGQQADAAVDAGADFLIAPNVDEEVLESASGLGVLHVPGALTPTEIVLARRLGAPAVKLFPAARLGAAYVRDLSGPLPGLKLIATGGVSADNAAEFLNAGCIAVAAGGALAAGDADAARRLIAVTSAA
jgi:2-dehydro-3-deoxyphosphogluconate aldolase / (4S)-4-hydroxy-2-oxoglutarate aldolase